MSNPIAKLRLKAFQKQSGLCYYCESRMWLKNLERFANQHAISKSAAARFQCTAEHLVARCDGGSNKNDNIVAACIFCNQTRHKRRKPLVPVKHRAHIKRRLKQGKWHPKELQHLVYRTAVRKNVLTTTP